MNPVNVAGLGLYASLAPDFGIEAFGFNGQSLGVGDFANPQVVTTTQPFPGQSWMLNDTTGSYVITDPGAATLQLLPLIPPQRPLTIGNTSPYPDNLGGEDLSIAFMNTLVSLRRKNGVAAYEGSTSTVGQGGAAMSVIQKGGTGNAYDATIYEATAIRRLAGDVGKTFGYGAIVLTHGEQDAEDQNLSYGTEVGTLQANYDVDLRALTGQARAIPLLATQQNSFPQVGVGPNVTALELFDESRTNASVILAGPKYWCDYDPDRVHLVDYRPLGEFNAWVWSRWVASGGSWQGTVPFVDAIARVGRVVTIPFNVTGGPLLLDPRPGPHQSGTYALWGTTGFEATDSSGLVAIASVVLSGAVVTVTLGADPVGTSLVIAYALTSDLPSGSFQGGFPDGQCGRIRTTVGFTADYDGASGVEVFDWCPTFQVSVP